MDCSKILAKMSLTEKIGQLFQLEVFYFTSDAVNELTGPQGQVHITDKEVKLCGSALGTSPSLPEIQKRHTNECRHHIPMLFMRDVIHGFKTIYPIPLALGCSFNLDLVKECCGMAAKEARAGGIQVTFSPMADLARDARWGRVMESTGEDPYLNSEMVKTMVEGYRSNPNRDENLMSCVKHFLGYGGVEAGREYNAVDVSEHTLRQMHLPSYKAAVDAGVEFVMTDFTTLNAVPISCGKRYLRKMLREELGFKGVTISDYNAVRELLNHAVCENEREVAKKSIIAGMDIEMMSDIYVHHLEKLVKSGEVSESLIDEAVLRILEAKDKLGLFDNPTAGMDMERLQKIAFSPEHRAIARRAATESCVLLQNEQKVLPIDQKKTKKIALVGPFGNLKEIIGGWACEAWYETDKTVTLLEGLKNNYSGEIECVEGVGYQRDYTDLSKIEAAIEAGKNSDVIILAVGEHQSYSGEACSKTNIRLPEAQMVLITKILKLRKPTVVVLFTGRPLDLSGIVDDESKPSVLLAWQPGTEGGNAIAELLLGKAIPSGKLTMSFPYNVGQLPIYYNALPTGRPKIKEDDFWVSRYMDCPNEPRFCFGYGLSYTNFSYSDISINKKEITSQQILKATVDVTNTGDYRAKETVQLYIRDNVASISRPVKELKGFQKITLSPGETKKITFKIGVDMLKFWNEENEFVAEPGEFTVMIGSDSSNVKSAVFRLK